MVMSGLLVGSLLQAFLWDNVLALEHKLWVFARYGTAYRSIYTLFEITFAGVLAALVCLSPHLHSGDGRDDVARWNP